MYTFDTEYQMYTNVYCMPFLSSPALYLLEWSMCSATMLSQKCHKALSSMLSSSASGKAIAFPMAQYMDKC